MSIDKETLELIQQTAVKAGRDTMIKVTEHGAYTSQELEALYVEADPDEGEGAKYDVRTPEQTKENVSNVDSLITAVIEEAKRLENKTGSKMTVVFSQTGGVFQPDVDLETKGVKYVYNRKFSNQWNIIKQLLNANYMDHFTLIQSLRALKPSLIEGMGKDGYIKLTQFYSKLKLNSSSELTSQPEFSENGELGEGYTVQFTLKSGADTEALYLPTKLQLKLPYVKNSDKLYALEIEISIIKNNGGAMAAKFLCSDYEQVEEEAMKDEIDKFKAAIQAKLPDLLMIESF